MVELKETQPPEMTEEEARQVARQVVSLSQQGVTPMAVECLQEWATVQVMRGWDAGVLVSSEPEAMALEMARDALEKTKKDVCRIPQQEFQAMRIDQCVAAMVERLESNRVEMDWMRRERGYKEASFRSPAASAADDILGALADAVNGRSSKRAKLNKRRKQLAKALGMRKDASWEWMLDRAQELREEQENASQTDS